MPPPRITSKQPFIPAQTSRAQSAEPPRIPIETKPPPRVPIETKPPPPVPVETKPVKSSFDATPVQRIASQPSKAFVTPPPPAAATHGAAPASSAAPESGAKRLSTEELSNALNAGHALLHGGNASGPLREKMMARAEELNAKGMSADDIKWALHREMTEAHTGQKITPAPAGSMNHLMSGLSSLGGSQQTFGGLGSYMGSDLGGKTMQLMSIMNQMSQLGSILGSLNAGGASASNAAAATHGAAAAPSAAPEPAAQPLSNEELSNALNEGHTLIHGGNASGPLREKMMARAKQLNSEGMSYDDIKWTLHREMLEAKTGKKITPAPAGSMNGMMGGGGMYGMGGGMYGMGGGGGMYGSMMNSMYNSMLGSSGSPGSPLHNMLGNMGGMYNMPFPMFGGMAPRPQFDSSQMFQQMMSLASTGQQAPSTSAPAPSSAPSSNIFGKGATVRPSTPSSTFSSANLGQAVKSALQLAFGAKADGAQGGQWMDKAQQLAKGSNSLHAITFALETLMRGQPSASPGVKLPSMDDKQLEQLVGSAHQVAFKAAPGGPHVGAWVDRARELATQHGNDPTAVKMGLHALMTQVK